MDLIEKQTWYDERGQLISRSGMDVVNDLEFRLTAAKAASQVDVAEDLSLVLPAFKSGERSLSGDVWNAIARNLLFETAHYLLESGVSQEWQMSAEYDPIMEAVDANSIPMVSLLLDHGWTLDHVVNVTPENAVTLAARKGYSEMFQFLMDKGARLEQHYRDYELTCDPAGEPGVITPGDVLRSATEGGSRPIIQYVMERMGR